MDGAAVGRCEGFATVKLVAYNKAALDAKRLEAELPEIAKKYRTTYAVRYLSPSLTPNPKGS